MRYVIGGMANTVNPDQTPLTPYIITPFDAFEILCI